MNDGGIEGAETGDSFGYESKDVAIERYREKYAGARDILRWGELQQPIEIIYDKSQGQTFINLGGVSEIKIEGNGDDDINKAVQEFAKSTPDISSRYEDIHPSRLQRKPLKEPQNSNLYPDGWFEKSYFVITGKVKQKTS
jgi:hypothetical protein